jgi:hypothetical protein
MGVTIHHSASLWYADLLKQTQGLGSGGRSAAALMYTNRLCNLIARRKDGVQGRHGLLKDHRHVRTTNRTHLRGIGAPEINDAIAAPAQSHLAIDDTATTMLH